MWRPHRWLVTCMTIDDARQNTLLSVSVDGVVKRTDLDSQAGTIVCVRVSGRRVCRLMADVRVLQLKSQRRRRVQPKHLDLVLLPGSDPGQARPACR